MWHEDPRTAWLPSGLSLTDLRGGLEEGVERLSSNLALGRRWVETFPEFWLEVAGVPVPSWPPREGRSNWIWLTGVASARRFLDLGSPYGDAAVELTTEFSRASYLTGHSELGGLVRQRLSEHQEHAQVYHAGPGLDIPTVPQQDCIAFFAEEGWSWRVPELLRDPTRIPVHAHSWLTGGGWFVAQVPNPWFRLRRGRRWGDFDLAHKAFRLTAALTAGIRRAGFSTIRTYYASPARPFPIQFVPRCRKAVRGFLRSSRSLGPSKLGLRSLLHPLLFPSMLIIAQR